MIEHESRSEPQAEVPSERDKRRVRKRRKREQNRGKRILNGLSRHLTVAIVAGIWLIFALYIVFKLIMYEAQPSIP